MRNNVTQKIFCSYMEEALDGAAKRALRLRSLRFGFFPHSGEVSLHVRQNLRRHLLAALLAAAPRQRQGPAGHCANKQAQAADCQALAAQKSFFQRRALSSQSLKRLLSPGQRPDMASISISHCRRLLAFVFSFEKGLCAGLDVEEAARLQSQRALCRISSALERESAPHPALLWPAKESACKALSAALPKRQIFLRNCHVSRWQKQGPALSFRFHLEGCADARADHPPAARPRPGGRGINCQDIGRQSARLFGKGVALEAGGLAVAVSLLRGSEARALQAALCSSAPFRASALRAAARQGVARQGAALRASALRADGMAPHG